MPKKDHLVLILLLIAITVAIYFDSFNNQFLYDDYPFVVENTAIRKLGINNIIADFTDRNTASASESLSKDVWRPLVTISFALDYSRWRLDPRFYHIENTLLHAANAALVYIAVFLILGDGFAAFIAALVFAIHPVQTEAVTWVSGRSNVLFLLFFLLAFISHVRNRQKRPDTYDYTVPLLFFILALLSKEMAITLPLVLALYDAHFSNKRRPMSYVGYYFPFALVAASYVATRFAVLGTIAQRPEWWGGSVFNSMLGTLKAVAEYLRLILVPVNLKVSYLADVPRSVFGHDMIGAIATLSAAAVFYLIFRRKKEISFYVLWFFAALVPVYNIVPFKAVMAERFLYLPLVGFAALFGIAFSRVDVSSRLSSFMKGSLVFILISVLVMYGAMSIGRNIEWRDEISFYLQETIRSPQDAKAHYNLGYAYAKEAGMTKSSPGLSKTFYMAAIEEYKKAVSLKPNSQVSYMGLANAYSATGLYEQAVENFIKVIDIKENSDAYNNLGVAYFRKQIYDEALSCFKKALRLDPNHVNANINLGNAYFMKAEFAKAKNAWIRVVRMGGANPLLLERIKFLKDKGH